jgi:hypothetical protein
VKGYETRSLLRDEVLPKMGGDLDKLGRAFAAKKAGLKEVVGLYYFVLGLPRLLSTLRQHDEHAVDGFAADLVRKHFTEPLDEVYTNFTNLVRLVQTAVDLPAAHAHEYKLLAHFSDELGEIGQLALLRCQSDYRWQRHVPSATDQRNARSFTRRCP